MCEKTTLTYVRKIAVCIQDYLVISSEILNSRQCHTPSHTYTQCGNTNSSHLLAVAKGPALKPDVACRREEE